MSLIVIIDTVEKTCSILSRNLQACRQRLLLTGIAVSHISLFLHNFHEKLDNALSVSCPQRFLFKRTGNPQWESNFWFTDDAYGKRRQAEMVVHCEDGITGGRNTSARYLVSPCESSPSRDWLIPLTAAGDHCKLGKVDLRRQTWGERLTTSILY